MAWWRGLPKRKSLKSSVRFMCFLAACSVIYLFLTSQGRGIATIPRPGSETNMGEKRGPVTHINETREKTALEFETRSTKPKTIQVTTVKKVDPIEGIGGPLVAGIIRPSNGFLTLGVPTIRRNKGNYILSTLKSLIDNMSHKNREETTIVILLADFNVSLRMLTLLEITHQYQPFIDSGLIRVIVAPKSYYPSFEGLKRAYGHPESRVKWRSKQNFDYGFLFEYSVGISKYYMQLEDDILAVPEYIEKTREFIDSQKVPWVCLEFSELGYIGKLYRSVHLKQLAKFIKLFFEQQPPDVTYLYFNNLYLQDKRIIRKPTIFQHMGYYSSLSGKIQRLQDSLFVKIKQYSGDNPPASLFTNFEIYNSYQPYFAYDSSFGYFWAKHPSKNNFLLVVFKRPQNVQRIVVTTGLHTIAPTDMLANGILEISPTLVSNTDTDAVCGDYVIAGKFRSGKVDITNVTNVYHFDVRCIRIKCTSSQSNWIIFPEIAVFVKSNRTNSS